MIEPRVLVATCYFCGLHLCYSMLIDILARVQDVGHHFIGWSSEQGGEDASFVTPWWLPSKPLRLPCETKSNCGVTSLVSF